MNQLYSLEIGRIFLYYPKNAYRLLYLECRVNYNKKGNGKLLGGIELLIIDIIKDNASVVYYLSATVLGWMSFFQNRK